VVCVSARAALHQSKSERTVSDCFRGEQQTRIGSVSQRRARNQGHRDGVSACHGKKTLRLTDFATSNGPDVHVYLVAAADAKDNDTVKNAGLLTWAL